MTGSEILITEMANMGTDGLLGGEDRNFMIALAGIPL